MAYWSDEVEIIRRIEMVIFKNILLKKGFIITANE